jgi:nicotinate-nucleotide pyrophosphorylase (carboxylating)
MPASPKSLSADTLLQRLAWDDLDLAHLRRLVEMARDEDLHGLGLRTRPTRTGDLSTASTAAPRRNSAPATAPGGPPAPCSPRSAATRGRFSPPNALS